MVEKPTGYISKTGSDGTRSLVGPHNVGRFRKSYTVGACKKIKSADGIQPTPSETQNRDPEGSKKATLTFRL
jgi:hypothetical protein